MRVSELRSKLQLLSPVMNVNPAVYGGVSFQIKGKYVEASDGSVHARSELTQDTGVECGVSGLLIDRLMKNSAQEKEITFEVADSILKVIIGDTEAKFPTEPPRDFFPNPDELEWDTIPKGLFSALKLCFPTASIDPALGACVGAQLQEDKVSTTDRFQASYATLEGKMSREVIIPPRLAKTLIGFGEVLDRVYIEDNRIYFRSTSTGASVIGAVLIGKFPNVEAMVAGIEEWAPLTFPGNIEDVLRRHDAFLIETFAFHRSTEVLFTESIVKFRSKTPSGGELNDNVSWNPPEDLIGVEFNSPPGALAYILGHSGRVYYSVERNRMGLVSENFRHLLCLKKKG